MRTRQPHSGAREALARSVPHLGRRRGRRPTPTPPPLRAAPPGRPPPTRARGRRRSRSSAATVPPRVQLAQPSDVGLAVGVAAPPLAVIPTRAGIWKYVFSHAAGAELPIAASLVSVTTSGLLSDPDAPTVSAVVNAWLDPLVPFAYAQVTPLGVVARHPVCVVVRALVV